FTEALADDLNISEALAVVDPWVRSNPGATNPGEALGVWHKINSVLGLEESHDISDAEQSTLDQVEQWKDEMVEARAQKDYGKSDELRKKIEEAGYKVNQSKDGATLEKLLV
ncbi:MAG: hypothetical protein AAGA30_21930, partial [Planctomycetota bacterium]